VTESDDILREFLVESTEGLDQLERDLLVLEQRPQDPERLASIFRCIHTIKGTSGFLALPRLESVAHVGENVLSRLRDGALRFNRDVADTLLALVDALRRMLTAIEATGQEPADDWTPVTDRLSALNGQPEAAVVAQAPAAEPAEPVIDGSGHPVSETSIRVDVGLLDKLMTLVGELVLARNQVLQHVTAVESATFAATSQRLDLITTELQEGVMKTRMQPIGNVWSKLPRVVRDLAQSCGKQVRLEMEGKETELDKTLIEAIKDPLTHIVRNSVDHGIETPAARAAAGKPVEGRLLLRAYHEGGQVIIEIVDDGAGIDPEKVRRVAIARGVLSDTQAARMNERELTALLFAPGFSTAEKVTNVSGRGVGMDVVRTNIEKIGGTIDLQSVPGSGTTLRIKIPLTLAIIPALVVTTAGDRYAIPQVSLLELVRLDGDQARTGIEMIHGAPVYRLRGRLLPLVYLSRALGLPEQREAGDTVTVVVLRADDRQFGLVVDGVHDTEEIVVKPLGRGLKGLPVFAGATIMGDGRVALILDVLGVAQASHVLNSGAREKALGDEIGRREDGVDQQQTFLVVAAGAGQRVAVPLSTVARLEQFSASQIESSGARSVVQYRGRIMPLVDVPGWLGLEPTPMDGMIHVVVYTRGNQSIGLVVSGIVDIVDQRVTVKDGAARHCTLGAAVIQGRVTDLLDLEALVRDAAPEWLDEKAVAA
jgi:two-component system, chemotaxis family, sensor kinase CheA